MRVKGMLLQRKVFLTASSCTTHVLREGRRILHKGVFCFILPFNSLESSAVTAERILGV